VITGLDIQYYKARKEWTIINALLFLVPNKFTCSLLYQAPLIRLYSFQRLCTIPEIMTTLQTFIALVLHNITETSSLHIEILDREATLTNPHFSD
jgi:hypothetical protein